MGQAISRRFLTAKARVQTQASPCGTCGWQNGTGTEFSPDAFVSPPVSIIPFVPHTHSFIYPRSCMISSIDRVVEQCT
jgi:hypothetical protein